MSADPACAEQHRSAADAHQPPVEQAGEAKGNEIADGYGRNVRNARVRSLPESGGMVETSSTRTTSPQ